MPSVKVPEMNVEAAAGEEQSLLAQTAHKILLFYFGVVATAIEEGYDVFGRLVEHSKAAEQEGRHRVSRMVDQREEGVQKVESEISKQVRSVISRLAIPSKSDIEDLDQQISRLSQKIDGLVSQK